MSDIRSFFGGGTPKPSVPTSKEPASKKPGRGRTKKVVSDDDEEEVQEIKPNKPAAVPRRRKVEEPVEEEVSSSVYFADKKKAPVTSNKAETPKQTPKKARATNGTTPDSGRRSSRRTARANYEENDEELSTKVNDEDDGGHDDIYAENFKTGRKNDDYEDGSSEQDELPVRKQLASDQKRRSRKNESRDIDMSEVPQHKTPSKSQPSASTKKRRVEEDEDEEEDTPKKKQKRSTPRKPRAKQEQGPDNSAVASILADIPLIKPPSPPPTNGDSKGFQYQPGGGNSGVAPAAQGTVPPPEGAENCLAGMTFVFTGVLDTLSRDEAQNIVKRYGGKVTSAPSSKTSYVVAGSDAGPKKIETIKKLGIKMVGEEGFRKIIESMPANGGDSKAAAENAKKKAEAEQKMKAEAAEMERKEKERHKQAESEAAKAQKARGIDGPVKKVPRLDDRLWVDKYAPDTLTAVCGNKGLVEKLQNWLHNWPKRKKYGFKQAGPDGSGIYRAAMLHGPPGVGKTTAAHLVAKLEGYDVVESNASDTRSKKLVEVGLRGILDTTSLNGFFAGDGKKVDTKKQKLVLIMDEVDGMSAGDRGGVGAMAAVAKKTNIPIILICNDRKLPKMKPFDFVTADFPFRRPTVDMIRSRIMTICYREGMKLPTPVIDAIIEGSHGDIRQIINMISTIKLDKKQVDHTGGKQMSKAWEKHAILKPWDIVSQILRPEMFSQSSSKTLNDKIELYFNDHEFSYLMLQENYLKTRMSQTNGLAGRKESLKALELAEQAAESISDGDLVDRMIHGSQQQWSLMPTHAVFSFVRPASYVYGNFGAQVGFTSWLGNNSKQGKLSRYVKEIQGHMRLRASGDRHEIRQQYLPALWDKTVRVLRDNGKESAQNVIDFMDSYYLTRDDFDAMMELGLGPMDQEHVKIESQTKAAFTRLYNSQAHPMPFIKASAQGNAAAKLGSVRRDKPDLEEAVDESEEEILGDGALDPDAEDEEKDGEIDLDDLKKDKYIKAPKKKAAAKKSDGAGKGKGKAKRTKDDSDDDDLAEDEPKPKKGGSGRGGSAAGRGRGRGRGRG